MSLIPRSGPATNDKELTFNKPPSLSPSRPRIKRSQPTYKPTSQPAVDTDTDTDTDTKTDIDANTDMDEDTGMPGTQHASTKIMAVTQY